MIFYIVQNTVTKEFLHKKDDKFVFKPVPDKDLMKFEKREDIMELFVQEGFVGGVSE